MIRKRKSMKGMGITCLVLFFALVTMFPFYLMIVMGTHTSADLFKGISLQIGDYFLENLKTVQGSSFGRFYINSLLASIAAVTIGTLTSSMAGFALSKYNFRFRGHITKVVVALMMIPSQISLIAYVVEMRNMNLLDTLWPVIIPYTYSAFGVFWMKQSIDSSVPDEVLESARIDGASEFRIFFTIVMPFVKASLITIALLLFLWSWNSYLLPLVTINKMELYTVPLGVSMLNGLYRTDYAAKVLALTLGTLPLIVLFIFGSKYFIRGLTGGAVKG